jgi:hypothetical protein
VLATVNLIMENLTPLQDEYYDHFLNKTDYGKVKNTVYQLLADFTDRRGLGQEWEQIDCDIQEEIIQKWIDIVALNCG